MIIIGSLYQNYLQVILLGLMVYRVIIIKNGSLKLNKKQLILKKVYLISPKKQGVSYHTIRKWMGIHGLQFTAKEKSFICNRLE